MIRFRSPVIKPSLAHDNCPREQLFWATFVDNKHRKMQNQYISGIKTSAAVEEVSASILSWTPAEPFQSNEILYRYCTPCDDHLCICRGVVYDTCCPHKGTSVLLAIDDASFLNSLCFSQWLSVETGFIKGQLFSKKLAILWNTDIVNFI